MIETNPKPAVHSAFLKGAAVDAVRKNIQIVVGAEQNWYVASLSAQQAEDFAETLRSHVAQLRELRGTKP